MLHSATVCARGSRWLSQHDRRVQDLICSRMRLVNLPRNRTLFDIEDSASEVYCLVSGCVVITVPHPVQGMIHGHVMFAIERNKDSGLGVGLLLGFTFFMGIMLSRLIGMVLGMKTGASLIGLAFGGTSLIFFGMASLATVIKRDLSGMGKFLFVGAMILFFASLVTVFFPVPAMVMTILVLMLVIFSAYMLYDINQVVRGGETNYVIATLQIYMDIYNVFSALLSILGITNRD